MQVRESLVLSGATTFISPDFLLGATIVTKSFNRLSRFKKHWRFYLLKVPLDHHYSAQDHHSIGNNLFTVTKLNGSDLYADLHENVLVLI